MLPAAIVIVSALAAAPACRRDDPPPPTAAEVIAKLDGPGFLMAGKQLATFEDRGDLAAHLSDLVVALGHEEWQVRSLVAEAIGRVGVSAIPVLVVVLDSGPAQAQRPAVVALGHIGVASLPYLRDALGHDNEKVREGAQFVLRDMGGAAVPVLIEALLSDDEVLRSNAALTVRSLPDDALAENQPRLAGAFSNALARTSDRTTLWVMVDTLLRKLGGPGMHVIETELNNDYPAVHEVVLSALSTDAGGVVAALTSEKAAHLTSTVIRFLEAEDGGRQACAVLERLGARAKRAIPALVARLHARAAERKQRGTTSIAWPDCPAYALAKIGADAVAPATELLATDDKWVRAQALMLLAEIGPPAKSAAPAIEELMRDEPSLVSEAEKTLESIGARP